MRKRRAGSSSTPELAGRRKRTCPAWAGCWVSWRRPRFLRARPPNRPTQPVEEHLPAITGYEIVGELGRGGMGIVYKARHLGLKRLVALKVIQSGARAGARERARFRAEAEAGARLQHPNIVQVFEIIEHDGLLCLAMEFIDGGSLAQKTAGAPQPPRAAAELVEVLSRAIHSAHEQNVVHRDLKPANVLLTRGGVPKIADFGLAKKLDDQSAASESGSILGTPSYMAPEQVRGRGQVIGPATDVYALGAILYDMLTGRAPFKGASPMDTVLQVMHEEPVRPSRLQRHIPPDLETICLKCLSREPGAAVSVGRGPRRRPAPILERVAHQSPRRRSTANRLEGGAAPSGCGCLAGGVRAGRSPRVRFDFVAMVRGGLGPRPRPRGTAADRRAVASRRGGAGRHRERTLLQPHRPE